MSYDKNHGHSGTFIGNKDGSRSSVTPDSNGMIKVGDQELHRPQTRPHKDGDAPRDAKGERTDRGAAHDAAARPQSALPEPAKTAPWASAAEETPAVKSTDKKETR